MLISLEQFIKDTEGQYIDIDGAYGSQCWDYSGYYAKVVCGCPSFPTGNGTAIGVFNNFLDPLSQYFTKIVNNPNDPGQYPPVGAIVFWSYNHTGVVIASDSRTMTTLEEDGANDPNQDGIADGVTYRITRGYEYVAGWFIPIKKEEVVLMDKTQAYYHALGIYGIDWDDETLAKTGYIGMPYIEATEFMLDYANKNGLNYHDYIVNSTNKITALNNQITGLTTENTALKNQPPKEVIKEVIKEVPVEKIVTVTKEVPMGFDKLTFGELISAAFKKLLNIK